MATYKTEEGIILKTENATGHWEEATRWNGRNRISVATGSQWEHEDLYRSKKGRYWIEHTSQYEGSLAYATVISDREAAEWLLANEEELPEDLKAMEEEVCE